MLQNLFKREEVPSPSRRVKIVYIAFVVIVLLFYFVTMITSQRKPKIVVKGINKIRVWAGTSFNSLR